MPDKTDVINSALRLVGAARITSIADGSNEANVAADLYDDVLDSLLRAHTWNFATKRKKLARSSTAPIHEFDHAYPLPSDWLRTVQVSNNDAGAGQLLYRMEQVGGQLCIVTSADDVYLVYVSGETDPNLMTADFRRALEMALARDFAVPLAASNTLEDQLSKKASRALAQARSTDGMGEFPRSRPAGSWVTSRGGRWPRVAVEGE